MLRRHALGALLAVPAVVGLLLSSCANQPDTNLQNVTYRLKWVFNASAVGALYAESCGIFADHGLHVTIKEGGPERDAIKELELGYAQFGVASADQVVRAISKGAPIVVLAQLFQVNPLQWIYRPEITSVEGVHDLKGKTIGITYGGNDETIMKALLRKYEFTDQDVRLFSVRYDYTPFYQGEVDLWPVYQNAEGIVIAEKLQKSREPVRFFDPDVLGIRFVANSVVTTNRLLREQPELIRRFVRALLQGWQEALDPVNREKAVRIVHRLDDETPLSTMRKQLAATRTLVQPSADMKVGRIDREAWAQTERIMRQQGLIAEPVFVERILKPYGAGKNGTT